MRTRFPPQRARAAPLRPAPVDLRARFGPYWPQSPPGPSRPGHNGDGQGPRGAPKAPRHQRTRTNAWRAGRRSGGRYEAWFETPTRLPSPWAGSARCWSACFPPGPGAGTPGWTWAAARACFMKLFRESAST
jgi:hypothetical protein